MAFRSDKISPGTTNTGPLSGQSMADALAAAQQAAGLGPLNQGVPSTNSVGDDILNQAGGDPSIAGFAAGNVLRRDNPFTYYNSTTGKFEENIPGEHSYYAFRPAETMAAVAGVSLDAYKGEYWTSVSNPDAAKRTQFQTWLAKRAAVVFGVDLIKDDGSFNLAAGQDVWNNFGNATASNQDLAKNITPEDFANMMYSQKGGDATYDKYIATAAQEEEAAKVNPITTFTQTSYTTMNKGTAEAQVDQLARGLLGHLATDKQLARYRGIINSFLKANPSVSTTTRDATDPNAVKSTTHTKEGASGADAVNMLEMKLRRGSEGMAYNAGSMIETALAKMDRGL